VSTAAKYIAVLGVSARETLRARGELLARGIFMVILLLVFSRLWEAVGNGEGLMGIGPARFLWYLALTEWVTLAIPLFYLSIEEDVRRGDVAYRLARPVSYVWMKLAEGAGQVVVRLLVLAAVVLAVAPLLAGAWPDPRGLLCALPLGLLAGVVLLLIQVLIGWSVFWLHDGAPAFWMIQKLQFVFGGLFWPLDIYPDWMQSIAAWTPFSAAVYGVGRNALSYDPEAALMTAMLLGVWIGVLGTLVAWAHARTLRVVEVGGG